MPAPRDETVWVEVESEHGGDPTYIRVGLAVGETPTDEVLTEQEIEATEEANEAAEAEAEYDATSVAEQRAAELGVDLSTISGTGVNGKITKADVEEAAANAATG